MGREDAHLHAFYDGEEREYGRPDADALDSRPVYDERQYKVSHLASELGDPFKYE